MAGTRLLITGTDQEPVLAKKTYSFEVVAPIPSDIVFSALTDFSDKRRIYYPISRNRYRVLEQTKTTARVQEGTGPIFSQERYDWSTKGRIWSVIEDSNVAAPGGFTDVRVSSHPSGGSQVAVRMERDFQGWRGNLLYVSATLQGGSRFFRRALLRTLRHIQREAIRERQKQARRSKR
jgi:hypothetical protein